MVVVGKNGDLKSTTPQPIGVYNNLCPFFFFFYLNFFKFYLNFIFFFFFFFFFL